MCDNRDQLKQGEDNRAPWERPTFRRLVTEDAEAIGILHDEGNPNDRQHSATILGC